MAFPIDGSREVGVLLGIPTEANHEGNATGEDLQSAVSNLKRMVKELEASFVGSEICLALFLKAAFSLITGNKVLRYKKKISIALRIYIYRNKQNK